LAMFNSVTPKKDCAQDQPLAMTFFSNEPFLPRG
jgi:hypothetical protein